MVAPGITGLSELGAPTLCWPRLLSGPQRKAESGEVT